MATTTTMATATRITATGMAEGDAALYRLLAWISPAYPVGAYTYSHGLEAAVEEGAVRDRQGLADYIAAALTRGAGAVDGPLLAAAWRAARDGDEGGLDEVAELDRKSVV